MSTDKRSRLKFLPLFLELPIFLPKQLKLKVGFTMSQGNRNLEPLFATMNWCLEIGFSFVGRLLAKHMHFSLTYMFNYEVLLCFKIVHIWHMVPTTHGNHPILFFTLGKIQICKILLRQMYTLAHFAIDQLKIQCFSV